MKKLFLCFITLMIFFAVSAVAESDGSEIHISGRFAYRLLDDGTAYIFRYLGDPGDGVFPPHEIDGYPADVDPNIAKGVYVPEFYTWAPNTFIPFTYTLLEDGTAELCYSLTPDIDEYPIPEYIEGFRVSGMSPYYRETLKTCGDFDYFIRKDGTAEITSWRGNAGSDLIIPEQLDGYPVTVIGSKVLRGDIYRVSPHRIYIPKTVKSIRSGSIPGANIAEIVVAPENPVYTVQDGMLINRKDQAVVRYVTHSDQKEINVPDGISCIHDLAFNGVQYVTTIILPDSVKKIGSNAFYIYSDLDKLIIPASIEYAGDRAFHLISGKELVITAGDNTASHLETQSDVSFLSDSALVSQQPAVDWSLVEDFNSVQLEKETADFAMVSHCLYSKWDKKLLKYCPQGEAETGTFVIPEGTLSIAAGAFSDAKFTGFVIPEGITYLWDDAFSGCKTLKSFVVPQHVTVIGRGAFLDCRSLENIVIPEGVTSIGDYAFRECTALESVALPESVTSIGTAAFEKCTSLKRIEIPEGVVAISDKAFSNCGSLESISIPHSVKTIGVNAFEGCKSLSSVVLPEGIEATPRRTFGKCGSLTSVNIPASVTYIDERAFDKCNPVYTVVPGTYGESWCQENGFTYIYAD